MEWTRQLECLVQKHGMRELLDGLAEIAEAYVNRDEALPWDAEIGGLEADETQTVAANLRAEMF